MESKGGGRGSSSGLNVTQVHSCSWVVVFICRQLPLFVGSCFCGQLPSFMGGCLCLWAFVSWVVRVFVHGFSSLLVGGHVIGTVWWAVGGWWGVLMAVHHGIVLWWHGCCGHIVVPGGGCHITL